MPATAQPETDTRPAAAVARRRMARRPVLSPELSELLSMLDAFEKSLAPEAARR
ncbi:MAG: hypothetical protein M3N38_04725 [Pseudomonadota bacterium]|nr:hypothetical protein [Pseudomonadota bacterium]